MTHTYPHKKTTCVFVVFTILSFGPNYTPSARLHSLPPRNANDVATLYERQRENVKYLVRERNSVGKKPKKQTTTYAYELKQNINDARISKGCPKMHACTRGTDTCFTDHAPSISYKFLLNPLQHALASRILCLISGISLALVCIGTRQPRYKYE